MSAAATVSLPTSSPRPVPLSSAATPVRCSWTSHRRRSDGLSIDYHVVDATDEDGLVALGGDRFDGIVVSMVLMDLPVIDPLLRAAAHLLRRRGRLVFSVLHPCFNNPSTVWVIEEQRDLSRVNSIKVSDYRNCVADYRAAGEPASHRFFHRSLSTIIGSAAAAGFVLDALDEPLLDGEAVTTSDWGQWAGIPPVLVARLRPTSAVSDGDGAA